MNRQTTRMWLWLIAAVLCLFLAVNVVFAFQLVSQSQLLDQRFVELNDQVAGLREAANDYTPERLTVLKTKINFANEIIASDQFRWSKMFSRFETVMPDGVSVRSVLPDYRDRSVKLSGYARDINAMTQFIDNLLQSPDLDQVFLQNHGDVEIIENGVKRVYTGYSLVIRGAF